MEKRRKGTKTARRRRMGKCRYLYAVLLNLSLVVLPFSSCAQEARQPAEAGMQETGGHKSGVRHDPIEDDPRYKEIFETINAEVDGLLKDDPNRGQMGFVHVFWEAKKRLLRQKYGIDWRSPGEMNPHIIFD